jgi:hypothetical protein
LQRIRHLVGIEDDAAVDVARGAADGLHQRGLGAQEAFLVRVQDADQRAFGNVQSLAQQIDADQHVESAEAQVADDLDALQGLHVGVDVAHADAGFVQIFGQILGHALGQRGDQHALRLGRRVLAFGDDVVDLAFGRADDGDRVDQAGRADHLLDEDAAAALKLPRSGVAET